MGFKIIDNFLDDFESFREYCDSLDYDGFTNPVDDVFYEGVNINIPENIKAEIEAKLGANKAITINAIFLRLSTTDMHAPHQAHTDAVMGSKSLMLYMNRLEDCEGGTSLVMHKRTGLNYQPVNDKQLKVWGDDMNTPDAWQIYRICNMIPNRAFLFDANLMHRAEPIGGFGNNAKNGRLVLTAFYD